MCAEGNVHTYRLEAETLRALSRDVLSLQTLPEDLPDLIGHRRRLLGESHSLMVNSRSSATGGHLMWASRHDHAEGVPTASCGWRLP